jgi:hypothetical protein
MGGNKTVTGGLSLKLSPSLGHPDSYPEKHLKILPHSLSILMPVIVFQSKSRGMGTWHDTLPSSQ